MSMQAPEVNNDCRIISILLSLNNAYDKSLIIVVIFVTDGLTYLLTAEIVASHHNNMTAIVEVESWLIYQYVTIECSNCLCKYCFVSLLHYFLNKLS